MRNEEKHKKNMKRDYVILSVCVILLCYCGILAVRYFKAQGAIQKNEEQKSAAPKTQKQKQDEGSAKQDEEPEKTKEAKEEPFEAYLKKMTLEQKIAQLFIVTPDSFTGIENDTQAEETLKSNFEQTPVGGFIMMGNNISDGPQITEMNARLAQMSMDKLGLKPFLSIDEEGGRVLRIASNINFPEEDVGTMASIGATGDPQNAYNVGTTLGAYLNKYGFNVDFAPDADVLLNPDNSVIGDRSFGTDPGLVSQMVTKEIEGLKSQKVAAAVKHFPGHGYTEGDSHEGFAYSNRTMEEIQSCELLPFQAGISAGVEFVMVGHISYPNIVGDNTPASISGRMVTDLLRQEMKYDGIVITDAMDMGAIVDNYAGPQAAVEAVKAGCDMILMPADFQGACQAVLTAVQSGEITEDRIDESMKRIINTKLNMQ